MDAPSGGSGAVERDPMAVTEAVERRTRSRPGATPTLPDDIVWEILLRLPTKALLRLSAVCRTWRNWVSDPRFLAERPSLPIIAFHGKVQKERLLCDVAIDTFDLRQSPAERRPVFRFDDFFAGRHFVIHASCDGLLLVSVSNGRFTICNPATRQWAPIPDLTGANIAGLYLHHLSGEYRILYWKGNSNPKRRRADSYHVLTVGSSDKPRCIGCPVVLDSMKPVMQSGIDLVYDYGGFMCPPILLRNCLHWDPNRCLNNNRVVVFDTVLESFRSMSSPTAAKDARLLEMDDTLNISSLDDSEGRMRVWVLKDYESEVWSLGYQIVLPAVEVCRFDIGVSYKMVLSREGDILVWSHRGKYLLHCDSKGKILQELGWGESWALGATGHWFKESLARHTFFQIPSKGGRRAKQPRFFQGL